ncbi:MAG: hypothetical protein V4541_14975 [Bacteroidota bacterium]
MKNLLFGLLIFFMVPIGTMAQYSKNVGEKMKANKVAFLTTKLDLSVEEAKIFWPIFNDFYRDQYNLREQQSKKMIRFKKISEIDDLSDAEIQAMIFNDFDFRQKDLNIEKKYYNKLRASLPIKIVGKFYRAQEAFKRELLNQYRGGGERH